MAKERWFNYRPIALAFLSLLLGSILAFYFHNNIIIYIVLLAVISILLITVSIVNRRVRELIIVVLFTVLGVIGYLLAVNSFEVKPITELPENINGKITSVATKDYYVSAIIEDVEFDEESMGFNIVAYIEDSTQLFKNIKVGNVISFKPSEISGIELIKDNKTPQTYYYKNNIRYTVNFKASDSSVVKTDFSLADRFKSSVKSSMNTGLDSQNANLAYSAMFGDKTELDHDSYEYFKLSGVAHLLAVSGFHVGIIVLILNKILDCFKTKNIIKLIIISVLLVFYSYLCDFTFSVIRASIMSIILLGGKTLFKEYDSLTALGFNGIIIFLICPLCVFDAGFLLSFLSVFGIVALYKPIYNVLLRVKLGKAISSSFAISLSVLTTIMFVQIYFFGTVNFVAIISNLIMIPLFSLVFSITFVVSILGIIMPFVMYIIYPINYVFTFIQLLTNVLGQLSFAYITVLNDYFITVVIYFALIFVLSRFCVAKRKHKVIISSIILALLVGVLI